MPLPGIKTGLPTMSMLKYNKFPELDSNSCRPRHDFSTGPSELDSNTLQKAVLGKIPLGGANFCSSEWNYYVFAGLYFYFLNVTLKKISATHVIKLGFAPKAYPPGQHRKTSTVNDKMYCLCD
jgi:hypothetical protein